MNPGARPISFGAVPNDAVVDQKLRDLVDQFSILLATSRALLRNQDAKTALLDTYDDTTEQILRHLRQSGFSPEDLMALERHLAGLRLALDQASSAQRGR